MSQPSVARSAQKMSTAGEGADGPTHGITTQSKLEGEWQALEPLYRGHRLQLGDI